MNWIEIIIIIIIIIIIKTAEGKHRTTFLLVGTHCP